MESKKCVKEKRVE